MNLDIRIVGLRSPNNEKQIVIPQDRTQVSIPVSFISSDTETPQSSWGQDWETVIPPTNGQTVSPPTSLSEPPAGVESSSTPQAPSYVDDWSTILPPSDGQTVSAPIPLPEPPSGINGITTKPTDDVVVSSGIPSPIVYDIPKESFLSYLKSKLHRARMKLLSHQIKTDIDTRRALLVEDGTKEEIRATLTPDEAAIFDECEGNNWGRNAKIAKIKSNPELSKVFKDASCSVESVLDGVESLPSNINFDVFNEIMSGTRKPEDQALLDAFHEKNKETGVNLKIDNDISGEALEKEISKVQTFIDSVKEQGGVLAQNIVISKYVAETGVNGFFETIKPNQIMSNYNPQMESIGTIFHENIHLTDYLDNGFSIDSKENPQDSLPKEIAETSRKFLNDYATSSNLELVAVLGATLTQEVDSNKVPQKVRARKDEDGNIILMVDKNAGVTQEELDKFTQYYRETLKGPVLYTMYNEEKDKEQFVESMLLPSEEKAMENFLDSVGEKATEVEGILKDLAKTTYIPHFLAKLKGDENLSNEELCDRLLNIKSYLENNDIYNRNLPSLNAEKWKTALERNLFESKNGKYLSSLEILVLTDLTPEAFDLAKERGLTEKADDLRLALDELIGLAILTPEELKIAEARGLLDNLGEKTLNATDVKLRASLSDDEYATAQNRELFKEREGGSLDVKDFAKLISLPEHLWSSFEERGLLGKFGDRYFSFDEMYKLSMMPEDKWEKAKSRDLLSNFGDMAYSADSIAILADMPNERFVQIKDLLSFKPQCESAFVSVLKNATPEEIQIIKDRGIYNDKDFRRCNYEELSPFLKLSDVEWENLKKRKLTEASISLEPDIDMLSSQNTYLLSAPFDSTSPIYENSMIMPFYDTKCAFALNAGQFSPSEIAEFAKLSDAEWQKILDRGLLDSPYKSGSKIMEDLKYSDKEWEDAQRGVGDTIIFD